MRLVSLRTGKELCDRLVVAEGIRRFIGLLGRRTLDPREGLLIPQCHAVHTFFMRFPIAVVFLDDDMRILRMEIRHPWRLPTRCARASAVLELHPSIFTSRPLHLGEKLKVW